MRGVGTIYFFFGAALPTSSTLRPASQRCARERLPSLKSSSSRPSIPSSRPPNDILDAQNSPGGSDCFSFSAFSASKRTSVYRNREHRILNLVAVGCLADLDLVEAVVEWCLIAVFLIRATVGWIGKQRDVIEARCLGGTSSTVVG